MPHPVLSQALEPGVKLGNFIIRDLIGANRHSYIYLGYDRELEREVIVKESFPMGLATRIPESGEVAPISPETEQAYKKQTDKFLKQSQMMAGLECGGIIPTFGVYEALGTAYAVVAKTNGVILEKEIENRHALHKKWEPAEVQNLLVEILKTLKYLHAHNIYHHKIRPSHILITRGFHPLLVGFDFSGPIEEGKTKVILSTECVSPEVLLDLDADPAAADIYSLGATFYKIILGTYPKRGDVRYHAIKESKLTNHPILTEIYPKSLLASIDKALEPHQEDRFSNTEAWLEFIHEFCPETHSREDQEKEHKRVIIDTALLLNEHSSKKEEGDDYGYNDYEEQEGSSVSSQSRRRRKNEDGGGFSTLMKKLFYKNTTNEEEENPGEEDNRP